MYKITIFYKGVCREIKEEFFAQEYPTVNEDGTAITWTSENNSDIVFSLENIIYFSVDNMSIHNVLSKSID